jgi:N6-adenosine-specific RNA methylase IME4
MSETRGPVYRTIVADPPWRPRLHANTRSRFGETRFRGGPQKYYPTMTVEQIARLTPPSCRQSHLYLWVLSQHVDWGYEVARAWGFRVQQMLTWAKPGLGTGQFQCNSEHILVCRRGSPNGNPFGKTRGTWFTWPRGRHSQKPEAFYDLVGRMSPGPYLEMFARSRRLGWDAWGNEVASDVALGGAA